MQEVRAGIGRCPGCEHEKSVDAFPNDRTKANGRATLCRVCDNAKAKAYYHRHRGPRLKAIRDAKPNTRRCKCGDLTITSGHRYCEVCRSRILEQQRVRHRTYLRKWRQGRPRPEQESAAARGYGYAHQQIRKVVAPWVSLGLMSCARCGESISPIEPWHLDHTDDRASYLGASHQRCNCATTKPSQKRRRLATTEVDPLPLIAEVYGHHEEPSLQYAA